MPNNPLIGRRSYHYDSGHYGTILDVHLHVRPQTALFHHDDTPLSDANWVNLEKLQLDPPETDEEPDPPSEQ